MGEPNLNKKRLSNQGLLILHQNVNSIGNCVNEIEVFLRDNNCDIFCVSEHWQSADNLGLLNILNYKLISSFCRTSYGGTAIYCKNALNVQSFNAINQMSECYVFECAGVQVKTENKSVIIVICIYRNPSSCVQLFLLKLTVLLEFLIASGLDYVMAGDFNIDIRKEDRDSRDFTSLLESYGACTTISEYTRVTKTSKSCIDNIIVNNTLIYQSQVILSGLSDHRAQKIIIDIDIKVNNKGVKTIRKFLDVEFVHFRHNIAEENWLSIYNEPDVNEKFKLFLSIFSNHFNACFPITVCKINNTKKTNICNSPDIVACKNNILLFEILSTHFTDCKRQLSQYKCEYNKLLKENKQKYYNNKIMCSDNKSKTMWNIVQDVTGKNNITSFETTKPIEKANEFNFYFRNVAINLLTQNNLIHNSKDYKCNIVINNYSFFFRPVTSSDVINIVSKLKNKKSSGIDGIPSNIIKSCIDLVDEPLCNIINSSLENGIFPDRLKFGIIKPLFKSGDQNLLENYRPITLLTTFSKIIEMIVNEQIICFFNKHKLFNKNQHGFLSGKGVDTALYEFLTSVINTLEQGDYACGIFLDLSKAFDSIDHDILLVKLESYGIRGTPLKWFKSYLEKRKQFVKISCNGQDTISEALDVVMGVPQGSILGPLLFIIFVNDIFDLVQEPCHSIVNYADDTNILLTGKSLEDLVLHGSNTVSNIKSWFNDNKLLLNSEKTNCVYFKINEVRSTPVELTVDNIIYKCVDTAKFLGVHVDDKLRWVNHTNYVSKRLSSVCYMH